MENKQMSDTKKKSKPVFYFPELGKSVEADTLEEATKLAQEKGDA